MLFKIKSFTKYIEEKNKKKSNWHDWFAWYPIRIDDNTVVWLQTINRQCVYWHDEVNLFPFYKKYKLKK